MEKVCINHPESPSVGSCKACEKPVCLMCITEVQGVSFCSEACGSAYQEVKDWLERPAADEEWNPLAEAKAKPAAPVANAPAPAPAPRPSQAPTGAEMNEALAAAFDDKGSPEMAAAPAAAPSGPNRMPLYIAIAATVVVVIGAMMLFSGKAETPTPTPPPIAKVDPPKPVVPVVKVDPPKPEPVKVDPPKPEPAKVEPPKPEPAKVEPPKPVIPVVPVPIPVVKVNPPKPEPAKVEPPKPEPAKVEPPKPVVKVDPPKPEPAKVEPPKPPPPKPEPPPALHLAMVRDPWAKEKTGAWYRLKTSAAGKDSYKDIGLRETGAGYRVVVSQASAAGKTEAEQFIWTEPEEVSVFGSVNGDAKGTKYAADVVRTKSSKPSQFVFKDGPHAGAWFSGDATLTALESQGIKVKDREFPCSMLETELKGGAKAKTWICLQVPIGVIKSESAGATVALVDFGDDWEKRPPFPAPPAPVIAKVDPPPVVPVPVPVVVPVPVPVVKPEPAKVVPPPPPPPPPPKPEPAKVEPPKPPPPPPPPKVDTAKEESAARAKKSMADASALIKEASPMYGEISAAMDTLPGDKASLRDLYRKAERVQLKLSDARILYSSIRNDVPDPAVIDRRVKQLDELLEGVQDAMKTLKGRLE